MELLDQPLGGAYSAPTWGDIAMCAYDTGDLDTASFAIDKGLTAVSALSHLARPWLLATGALVATAQGDLDLAETRVAEGASYTSEHSIRLAEPFVSYAQAALKVAGDDVDSAIVDFADVAADAGDMRLIPLVVRSHKAAAAALHSAGRDDAAVTHEQAAARAIDDIAATFTDGEMRATYLATAAATP